MDPFPTPTDAAGASLVKKEDPEAIRRLKACEQQVKVGIVMKAMALREIHLSNLYKAAGYDSFKDYLEDRWGISRASGYRLVDAASGVTWAIGKGLVDAPEDVPSHMSQAALLDLYACSQSDDEATQRAVKEGTAVPSEAVEHARALLADPEKARRRNAPSPKLPAAPPGPRAMLNAVWKINDALNHGALKNPAPVMDGVSLADLEDQLRVAADDLRRAADDVSAAYKAACGGKIPNT